MPNIDLERLLQRLNDSCRRALEAAAGRTLSRTHYNVEVEHWLLQLVDADAPDVTLLLRQCQADAGRLSAELNRVLDGMATGNGRAPGLAPELVAVTKQAWLLASVEQGAEQVRSGHLLWAMLADETVGARLRATVPALRAMTPDSVRAEFARVLAESAEAERAAPAVTAPAAGQKGGVLEQYTQDLTARAREGAIDPVLGRNAEIRQIADILTRRRQNNPILTGEAGVGKTAIVEGFALRVAAGDVPPQLRGCAVRALDLGLLQAGAGIKGEFESRLRAVIDAVRASSQPIILFIDEAHTLIGAGGAAGQNDAANLLKPALARGELRTIAATTWAEYKRYFEKDAALSRRFQVVDVAQPDEATAIAMVRGTVSVLERHHDVRILDEAVAAAVRLSARYIPSRQLPDKAVSLIDTACARVGMSRTATPPAIEDRQRRLEAIETERAILAREVDAGIAHEGRAARIEAEAEEVRSELSALEARWRDEQALVEAISEASAALEQATSLGEKRLARERLTEASAQLHALQGEEPLVLPVVDAQAVATVVENWTGIPAGRMQSDEIETVLALREKLGQRVVGQDHALEAVAQVIRTSRAGLTDPRKPAGVFLMVGTSGVGKTETALALAELLYGGEQNLTTINMSEFKEEHKVSLLMGSPPGYVGYGEGGVLTEAVRRRPYSVILLDEIEKAHPGVQDIFYQVFDKGTMKDGEGRDIDFKNTVIIMTSNAGAGRIASLFADPETAPGAQALAAAIRPELDKHFKAAFLGRVTLVPYVPLAPETLRSIVRLQLARVARRVEQAFGASLDAEHSVEDHILSHLGDSSAGARGIESLLASTLLPDLSAQVLAHLSARRPVERVLVGVDEAGVLRCTLHSKTSDFSNERI